MQVTCILIYLLGMSLIQVSFLILLRAPSTHSAARNSLKGFIFTVSS